jgi:hypothetical protein
MFAHAGEVHGAKNNERHASGRPRVVSGPCPVSRQVPQNRRRNLLTRPPRAAKQLSSRWNTLRARGVTNKSHQVCARRRDSEAAGTVSGRGRRRCPQIVCRSRMVLLGQTPRLERTSKPPS